MVEIQFTMQFAINVNAVAAVYTRADVDSGLTSQLLFGELCTVLNEYNEFVQIEIYDDGHIGWVSRNTLSPLSKKQFDTIREQANIRICMPVAEVFNLSSKTIMRLPAGSFLPNYNPETSKFTIDKVDYQVHPSFISYLPYGNIDGMIEAAKAFANVPYMNGGKTVLGIDQSGFVQLILALCGYKIPRTLYEQSVIGDPVNSLEDIQRGDLLFVENSGQVLSVYISAGDNKIVGVSTKAEILELDTDKTNLSFAIMRRLV